MNLNFKRNDSINLNNTPITPNMLFFTTDSNNIYMDDKNNRYKMFGFTDDDIVDNLSDISENTFFSNSNINNLFLLSNQIATNGNTLNKQAIGTGYYNNVIGNNIEDVLYKTYPTIVSSLDYLKNNARSKLTPIWINDNPSQTWSETLSNRETVDETLTIDIDEHFLGYIVFIQAYIDDTNTIYPITTFSLPESISQEYKRTIESKFTTQYGYCIFTLDLIFSHTNNQLSIKKTGKAPTDNRFGTLDFNNFWIPIALYGWGI